MVNKLLNNGEIGVFALGGLGEVGKNTYIYEIENKIYIVDAGILFPDDQLLGIDYVIPDYTYLLENEERIMGLFITHGHEDHIGGIPYLLKKVKIPKIYASGIAVDLIEYKLNEHSGLAVPPIEEFKSNYSYDFPGVTISFIRLNHSIPDMFAICFDTKEGPLIHTGDFKIDFTPVGPAAEYDKLTDIGKRGCLALLSDSTNAEITTMSPSESKVGKAIIDLFNHIAGRIIIATFASNLYRIEQIIDATVKCNRKIAIFGRSMERAIEAGLSSGYIKAPLGTIIEGDKINHYAPEEVVLLCTGSQGEPLAALSRIAAGSHKYIKTLPGDTVIFSSSPIPGNQESINNTINKLYKMNADVIINSPLTDTHTSGHATQNDLKMLISLLKPKYLTPIHGEHRMQVIHKQLGMECGIAEANIAVLDNGEVLAISKNGIRLAGTVKSGVHYIDGTGVGDIGTEIIKERKLLSEEGLFSVLVTINGKERIIYDDIAIISRGFIYVKGSAELTGLLVKEVRVVVEKYLSEKVLNVLNLKKAITETLTSRIHELTKRNPLVTPVIVDIAGN